MTYVVGGRIQEPDLIAEYTRKCRDTIKGFATWYQGVYYGDGIFPADQLAPRDPGGPVNGDILAQDPTPERYEITAQYIANVMNFWSKRYTAIRKVRYDRYIHITRWGQSGSADYYGVNYQETQYASALPSSYQQLGGSVEASIDNADNLTMVATGFGTAKATMDAYLDELYNIWNSAKENIAVMNGYYCHDSCHSNCHWSRGGR